MTGFEPVRPPPRVHADPAASDLAVRDLIDRIAQRAQGIQQWHGGEPGEPLIDWRLRLTAAHIAGPPLRLAALLAADDPVFIHDVFGIRRHADPGTGLPDGRFRPRLVVTRTSRDRLGAGSGTAGPPGHGMSPES